MQTREISRIILNFVPDFIPCSNSNTESTRILRSVLNKWDKSEHTCFLSTCGGFFNWKVRDLELTTSWIDIANKCEHVLCRELKHLTSSFKRISRNIKYLTIGADFFKDSSEEPFNTRAPHSELVAVYDIKKRKIVHITGKSHPTGAQKRNLIAAPMESHFMRDENRRVLILGCHDLNMFSKRAYACNRAGGHVRQYMKWIMAKAKRLRIKTIIQHPHTTDSHRIWLLGWAGVNKLLRPDHYAGTGKYFDYSGEERSDLDEVLSYTRHGNVLDIVVSRDKQKYKYHVDFRT